MIFYFFCIRGEEERVLYSLAKFKETAPQFTSVIALIEGYKDSSLGAPGPLIDVIFFFLLVFKSINYNFKKQIVLYVY